MDEEPTKTARRDEFDLTLCDREPIHALGNIQPHGVLIATEPETTKIDFVSANFEASVGLDVAASLGSDIGGLLGHAALTAIQEALSLEVHTAANVLNLELPIPIRPFRNVLVHRHIGRVILELEDSPAKEEAAAAISKAQSIIARLRHAGTVRQLCDQAAQEIRALTGYDRVMVYRFDEAGNGAVVAEDKATDLEPYLDLHYPASDIPIQARRLYVLQRVRSIPDVHYAPVPVLALARDSSGSSVGLEPAASLDMSFCALRGVSPTHLEYLRNMGVRATLAVSLLQDNELWGMLVCHHMSPRYPSANIRALCDMIGQLVSALLLRVFEAEELAKRLTRHHNMSLLRESMESGGGVADALCRHPDALLAVTGAGGAMIRFGATTRLIGRTPAEPAVFSMVARLRQTQGEGIVGVADAGQSGNIAEAWPSVASGVLLMPIANNPGDAIAWFRPEVLQTVKWGGDPRKALHAETDGRLSPRKSFAVWSEQVSGCSFPWMPVDHGAAHDLRRTITAALLQRAEVQLAHLSAYDPLTGLANRRTLETQMERWRADANGEHAALLFLDIDRFKSINDTLGHAAGDEVLIEVATRLRRLAPADAVAGRLGGDEFVLFWRGAGATEAEQLGEVLVREFSRPFFVKGQLQYAGASVGIAFSASARGEDLMRQADAAMYASKRAGGGRAARYQPELHASVLTNMQTEQDLFHALDKGELEVHYQPLVVPPDRGMFGFEALARWRHPVRGWISPGEFIPRAEEAGLIGRIGDWVMKQAVRQLAAWRGLDEKLVMSINVAARQLTEGSVSATLAELVAEENVPPDKICLEVTESALTNDLAVKELHRARAMGVKIAVDDFGTGYSSLSYLQKLPVTEVKIDRCFVTPLGSDDRAERFFRAIVNLAHTLDLHTVAEGVETETQWRIVESAGCGAIQGWLISKALDAAAATNLLRDLKARAN